MYPKSKQQPTVKMSSPSIGRSQKSLNPHDNSDLLDSGLPRETGIRKQKRYPEFALCKYLAFCLESGLPGSYSGHLRTTTQQALNYANPDRLSDLEIAKEVRISLAAANGFT